MKERAKDDIEYISKVEMASRMHVTTRTIDSWMAKGLVPFRKIARTVRFSWREVQDHLNTRNPHVTANPRWQPGTGIAGLLRQRAAEIRKDAAKHDPAA